MTPTWHIVPYSDGDLDELVALSQYQPGKAAAITAEYVHWQRAANPAGLALVALAKETASGKIIGQLWVIPLRIQVGNEVHLGSVMVNLVVHPNYRRQGIFSSLVPFCYEEAQRLGVQFSYGFPNPNSYPGFVGRLAWADIGRARLFVRPLNIGRLIPRLGRGMLQHILAATGRAVGRFVFRPRPLGPDATQMAIAEVDTEDTALDDFWRRVRGKHPVTVVRDARFLHWRYTQIPERKYLVLAARQGGLIVAYVVLRCVTIEGILCGMVVDFLAEPTERGRLAGEVLLHRAAVHFQHSDVDLAGCLMLPVAEEISLLRRQGYVLCPSRLQPQPFPVILRANEGVPGWHMLHDIRRWFLTMGDFDAV